MSWNNIERIWHHHAIKDLIFQTSRSAELATRVEPSSKKPELYYRSGHNAADNVFNQRLSIASTVLWLFQALTFWRLEGTWLRSDTRKKNITAYEPICQGNQIGFQSSRMRQIADSPFLLCVSSLLNHVQIYQSNLGRKSTTISRGPASIMLPINAHMIIIRASSHNVSRLDPPAPSALSSEPPAATCCTDHLSPAAISNQHNCVST